MLRVFYAEDAPSVEKTRESLSSLNLGDYSVQKSEERGFIIKMSGVGEEKRQEVLAELGKLGEIDLDSQSFESIGPSIGKELREKTGTVLIIALLTILIYIALSFRRVSRPVPSYVYGVSSLIALCHDVVVPLGFLSAFSGIYGFEINLPVIAAFLTIFGYSVNDSVVVFDRLRENIIKRKALNFKECVNKSLNETIKRSINTSFTTLLVLLSIYLFGGETLSSFALVMMLGIFLGTYSSMFLATPLLVDFRDILKRNR